MNTSVFLRGEWRNLVFVNYEFDPAILAKYLPAHTELDTFNGKHYVSLTGLLYQNVKVKGVIVPYLRTFEEVNLHFYVRHNHNGESRRGIAFIKQIAPKKLIALVANKIFNGNYMAGETRHQWLEPSDEKISIEYMWKQSADWNWMVANADSLNQVPKRNSEEEFICEHYWAYIKDKKGATTEYGFIHPTWRVHSVNHSDIHCDFEKTFGKDLAPLNKAKPKSVFIANGSKIEITVKNKIA